MILGMHIIIASSQIQPQLQVTQQPIILNIPQSQPPVSIKLNHLHLHLHLHLHPHPSSDQRQSPTSSTKQKPPKRKSMTSCMHVCQFRSSSDKVIERRWTKTIRKRLAKKDINTPPEYATCRQSFLNPSNSTESNNKTCFFVCKNDVCNARKRNGGDEDDNRGKRDKTGKETDTLKQLPEVANNRFWFKLLIVDFLLVVKRQNVLPFPSHYLG